MLDAVTITSGVEVVRSGKRELSLLIAAGSVLAGTALVALLVLCFLVRHRRAKVDYLRLCTDEYAKIYSMKELRAATKIFTTILGEGAFGKVYKAEFPDGTMGAVKVEKPKGPDSSSAAFASDEYAVLRRVHHRNLVNLIGYCIYKGLAIFTANH
jgi:hypothetical protein